MRTGPFYCPYERRGGHSLSDFRIQARTFIGSFKFKSVGWRADKRGHNSSTSTSCAYRNAEMWERREEEESLSKGDVEKAVCQMFVFRRSNMLWQTKPEAETSILQHPDRLKNPNALESVISYSSSPRRSLVLFPLRHGRRRVYSKMKSKHMTQENMKWKVRKWEREGGSEIEGGMGVGGVYSSLQSPCVL